MPKLFALLDCSNFEVSCERLFRPALERRPLVALSKTAAGFIVARPEAMVRKKIWPTSAARFSGLCGMLFGALGTT